MGNATSAVPALCAATAISALELVHHLLDPQQGADTTAAARAQALRDAVGAFLPLAAAGGLCTSIALIYRHIAAGAAAGAGAGNRRLPGPVAFILCASAGLLQLLFFTVQAPGTEDHGAAAHALGLAALRALPAAATATYYLGMILIIVGHIRAGGEGGGTAVAGNGPIEAPVGLLVKMAIGAAAGLVCLMAMAAL
jgi:hypothetical protein